MEIICTGRHVQVTDELRAYAEEKVAKLPRYFDRISAIEVVLERPDPKHYGVELIVDADRHRDFVGRAQGSDPHECIDLAVDKLERQLTDFKERIRNRKHNVA